ncbi:MAG TPA: agmatine deiminase family protein, partial [Prolixibacteraceae bacterium]|nr:agmatine deiminase family protein [Prolixibacteraceae bacterium]
MKSKVYICDHLDKDTINGETYGKDVYDGLVEFLGKRLVKLPNQSANIWCRDYMPIKLAPGKYVQFKYFPSYMGTMKKYKGKYPDLTELYDKLELTCESSHIILDGGAIEVFGKKAIVSDRVFRDNPTLKEDDVYNEIVDKLNLEQLIVVPQYPYDFTGHVDGMVRFIDDRRVVVNDLDEELRRAKEEYSQRKKMIENWVYAF